MTLQTNSRLPRRAVALAFALALIATPAAMRAGAANAENAPLPVTLGPASELWLEGTSTVHDYKSRTKDLAVELARDAAAPVPTDAAGLLALMRAGNVRSVAVRVPVATLRSGKDALDKNQRKAMRAEQYPDVRFSLTKYSAPAQPAGDTLKIAAEGTLTVAGRERPITLDARAYSDGKGVWLEGSEPLLMSEYGIKPPTMMLGTLRVADKVTIHYRLMLIPGAQSTGSSTAGSN